MSETLGGLDHAGLLKASAGLTALYSTYETRLLVGGTDRSPRTERSFELPSARDGSGFARIADAGEADVNIAVATARRAFDEGPWPRLAPSARKATLLRLAELIERERTDLALLLTLEMGKPISDAWQIELRALIATFRWYAEIADKEMDEIAPTPDDALALVTREAVGVVGVVTPWNFPLTLSAWKIAPALAVGCTIVHKPSEQAPLTALRLAALAREAGIPDGVYNVITGKGPEAGAALGRHSGVDTLAFTGSTAVGRAFQTYSAESNLKRVWLELGGKSANIVLPDAPDLDRAMDTAAWGIFFNAGQMCTAPSRLILHEDIADDFLRGITARAEAYRPGDPLDPATQMGPLASGARAVDVQMHVDRARADGATLLTGGARADVEEDLSRGAYYLPTIFSDVAADSALAREEVFGPVLSVQRVANEEEAITLANDSPYGLAAGLWTADVTKVHQISKRLRAGTVWVNCYEEGDLAVPFGGVKQSGNGRDKSRHALEKYTELKTTYIQL